MPGDVVPFPQRRPAPQWVPEALQRELDAIERWVAETQHRLARLAYAEQDHHLAVRRIGNAMRSDLFTEWHAAQPRK